MLENLKNITGFEKKVFVIVVVFPKGNIIFLTGLSCHPLEEVSPSVCEQACELSTTAAQVYAHHSLCSVFT